ncbi:Replicative DNA helicase [Sarcina ventriculi]|uniref:replicative DNA helicase n=1 Tax=Sarcina ventriculi TaxID=1267 RepID=UPI000D85EA41|nr:DnaB-like helicase C-terminal domain-containing protein [Sarcina ventriculi]SPZ49684.1 Replicative DNA helicase [Sarcina ventriculi]
MKYILAQLHNKEIEKNIISACFQDNNLIDEIEIEWFYSSSHQEIIKGFKELRKKGQNIDVVIFCEYASNKKMPVTLSEITDIATVLLSLTNVKQYIDKLKDFFVKRKIYLITNKLDYNTESNDMLDNLSKLCEELHSNDQNKENTREYLFTYIDELYKDNAESKIQTGLLKLDNDIVGFLDGQLITISAYTGIGKSIFTSQLILNMLKQDKKIDLFSLEMGRSEIINKLVSNGCDIDFNKIYKKELSDIEKEKITLYISEFLSAKHLEIYDSIGDIDNIISTIKRDKLKNNIDIAFIDLINRVSNKLVNPKNRAEYLGELTRRLKLLALQLNIPIVITAQINRVIEGRQDKRPTLADIKESGGIAEDSDLVLGLYRNRELDKREVRDGLKDKGLLDYSSPNPDKNPFAMELITLKGRNVPVEVYSFNWEGKYQRIKNWAR